MSKYGVKEYWKGDDIHLEELMKIGFTAIEEVFDAQETGEILIEAERLLNEQEIGSNSPIEEKNMLRSPLAKSSIFRSVAKKISNLEIISNGLGTDHVQLQLQNGIMVKPKITHHQASWHRDLPYQHWVSSKPLSISVLLALTPFKEETGATQLIPFSHKTPGFPSEKFADRHRKTIEVRPGGVLIFDSMVYHRAGNNTSNESRWAVNHVFTPPFIKQQISLRNEIDEGDLDESERILFGHKYETPGSLKEFYER
jgi:ectoine hydroxylase-related dioxygenase (phytanoyl-CoA dioxygenase family)